ncbi:MAG: hypothetical protein AAF790_14750, partial [Planctomycetota bacterium]
MLAPQRRAAEYRRGGGLGTGLSADRSGETGGAGPTGGGRRGRLAAMQKSTKRLLLAFAATLAGVIGLLVYQNFGPNPPIIVSPATTHITKPLIPAGQPGAGLPDYRQAYLNLLGPPPAAEDNAAIPLLQAMWPAGLDAD